MFEREAGRYRDGEARLGDGTDERQRQLTRMGNAAWGAALCLLMQGKDASEWLAAGPRHLRRMVGVDKACLGGLRLVQQAFVQGHIVYCT